MEIGERLKKLRKRLGLTQREFAECVHGDVGPSWIGKIERGQSSPSFQMLERIAKTFSVRLSYFFEDDDFLLSLDLVPGEVRNLVKDKKKARYIKDNSGIQPPRPRADCALHQNSQKNNESAKSGRENLPF